MRNNTFIIARSGWRYVGAAFFAFVLFSLLDCDLFAFVSFVVMAAFVYIFRNPERAIMAYQPKSLVVPADGVVTAIETFEDGDYAYRVDIDSSYRNVALLRAPMSATVTSCKIVRGSRVAKNRKLFALLNEYAEFVLCDNEKNSIKIVHRLKESIVSFESDIKEGEMVLQSARYGFMTNGVTSLYLPQNFRLNLHIGENVVASETLVGYFS